MTSVDVEAIGRKALFGPGSCDLARRADDIGIDPARLRALGEEKVRSLVSQGFAGRGDGYLVVAARHAMADAVRQLRRADAGRATHDDVVLHERLRSTVPGSAEDGGWTARVHLSVTAPPRRASFSEDVFRMANEALNPKERRVVDGVFAGRTQVEIAEAIGHTQGYVSKLFRRAIRKLKAAPSKDLRSLGWTLQAIGRETRRARLG